MQTPLAIHALFHSQNPEGLQIFSKLYSLLCRDVNNPFSDGLDIPLYFSTGDDSSQLKLVDTPSRKKVILVFIDIYMYCSENWKKYIADLVDKYDADDNTIIVGVKLYKHAFSFNKKLGEIQSIVVDSDPNKSSISLFADDNWEIFQTRLFDTLIRFIADNEDKKQLAVFISHSKKDKGNFGEEMAKDVRNFLSSDTKLNSFFDVHDILDGYKFESQIVEHIKNSVLLILFTDTYSMREWCRIEALTAKKNEIPIVAVYMLRERVDRTFPYIGNVAISISESYDLPAFGIGAEMFKDLTIELTRHILKSGGHLVYGGDLRKNGYTELFKDLSNQYGQREKAEADVVYIDNYLSWPIFNNVTLDQKADYMCSRIKLINGEIGEFVEPDENTTIIFRE